MTEISVIIPTYRSPESLRELYNRLITVLEKEEVVFEIIFVEDCGEDDSWGIIKAFVLADKRVCGLKMSRNFGQHNALLAGIKEAQGELIVTLDDDLQHPPEEIPKLINKVKRGFDVVYGCPNKPQHGLFRNMASRTTKLILKGAIGAETARNVSAFRIFRTKLREAFNNFQSPIVNIDVLLTWGTKSFVAVPVEHQPRKYGSSNYTFITLVNHMLNMLTGFSTLPLKLATLIGLVVSLFGLAIFIFVLINYAILGNRVEGFTFLASIITIFSGTQLLTIGILGEYLSRIYHKNSGRPTYHISERV